MNFIKPRLSFWQIWNMSFGFLGIQFGFALQNANVSRIFQTMGADVEELALFWLAAPTTGLIIQPIIGYMSDRTWSRIGRRRPYFLVGAILASLALLVMPNSPTLWVAVGMLWILDASINISMEPFRALVADMLPPEQRNMGFAVQSFFIGTGAVIASMLPYILKTYFDVQDKAEAGKIPESVELSFYLGAFAYITAVIWTVIKTKEYPPEELKKQFEGVPEVHGFRNGVKEFFDDFVAIPKTMIQLAFVQFFSWFALFAMWIYTTSAVTKHIYGSEDTTSLAYNEGADWVGVCFAVYNGIAAIVAFGLPALAKITSRKTVHALALVMGGIGLSSIFFIRDSQLLILSMVGVGIAWASILSMPYAMLAGSLPQNKMGIYMGIFNFFIVIPQITAAGILGFFLKTFFGSEAIYALVLGGVAMFLAAGLVFVVKDEDDKVSEL
jgi:maltose/moltooligosaccharide transporter